MRCVEEAASFDFNKSNIHKKFKSILCDFEEIETNAAKLLKSGQYIDINKMNLLMIRDLARGFIGSYLIRCGDVPNGLTRFNQATVFSYNFKVRLWLNGRLSREHIQNPKAQLETALKYSAKQDWNNLAILWDKLQCRVTPIGAFVPYVICSVGVIILFCFLPKHTRPDVIKIANCAHGIADWKPCEQCTESQALLGFLYLHDNKPTLGKYLMEKACRSGLFEAKLLKAICLINGRGYIKDEPQALVILETLYKESSESPYTAAHFGNHREYLPQLYSYLGELYKKGFAGEQNVAKGEALIEQAKGLGYAPLQIDVEQKPTQVVQSREIKTEKTEVKEKHEETLEAKIAFARRKKIKEGTSPLSGLSSAFLTLFSLPQRGLVFLINNCRRKTVNSTEQDFEDLPQTNSNAASVKQPKPAKKTTRTQVRSRASFQHVSKRLNSSSNTAEKVLKGCKTAEEKYLAPTPPVTIAATASLDYAALIGNDDELVVSPEDTSSNSSVSETDSQLSALPVTPRSNSSGGSTNSQPGAVSPTSVSPPSSPDSPQLAPSSLKLSLEGSSVDVNRQPSQSSKLDLNEEKQQREAYRAAMAEQFGVSNSAVESKQVYTPRVYSAKELLEEYKIDLAKLRKCFPPLVDSVIVNLEQKSKNHEVRIGGGAVRELLLFGKATSDWDITTTISDDYINSVLKSMATNDCDFDEPQGTIPVWTLTSKDGVSIDVTPFLRYRSYSGGKYVLERSPDEIDPLTRNHPFNSLFLRRKKGSWEWELVDLTGHGLKDLLVDKLIRINGDPNIIFRIDPIRIIHCFYFQYRLPGFRIDETTLQGIRQFKLFLSGLRVGDKHLQLLKLMFKILELEPLARQACLTELKNEGLLNEIISVIYNGFNNSMKYANNVIYFNQKDSLALLQTILECLSNRNPNTLNKSGHLILHQAICQKNIIGIALLLCAGAKPQAKNKFNLDGFACVDKYVNDPKSRIIILDLLKNLSEKNEKEMVNMLCNLLKAAPKSQMEECVELVQQQSLALH